MHRLEVICTILLRWCQRVGGSAQLAPYQAADTLSTATSASRELASSALRPQGRPQTTGGNALHSRASSQGHRHETTKLSQVDARISRYK